MELNKIYNLDAIELLKQLDDNSVDAILTDPPYLYLKHKLDKPFDEEAFFTLASQKLKNGGLFAVFGRGVSLARWVVLLDKLGLTFKEEVVWNKEYTSSPMLALSRRHEMIMIFGKGQAKIRKVRVPYIEAQVDLDKMKADLKRIKTALNNPAEFEDLQNFLETKEKCKTERWAGKHNVTLNNEKGNVYNHFASTSAMQMIVDGKVESSIITEQREHYSTIHGTQKPVRLLRRLLKLISDEGDLVLDGFAGSGSTAVACIQENRNFLGSEIDPEYFALAQERVANELKQTKIF